MKAAMKVRLTPSRVRRRGRPRYEAWSFFRDISLFVNSPEEMLLLSRRRTAKMERSKKRRSRRRMVRKTRKEEESKKERGRRTKQIQRWV